MGETNWGQAPFRPVRLRLFESVADEMVPDPYSAAS